MPTNSLDERKAPTKVSEMAASPIEPPAPSGNRAIPTETFDRIFADNPHLLSPDSPPPKIKNRFQLLKALSKVVRISTEREERQEQSLKPLLGSTATTEE